MAGETDNKAFEDFVSAIKDLTNTVKSGSAAKGTKDPGKALTEKFEKDMSESVKYLAKGTRDAVTKFAGNLKKEFDDIETDSFGHILDSNMKRLGVEYSSKAGSVMKNSAILIMDAAKNAATAFAGAMIQFNKLWSEAMAGVEGAMKAVKNAAFKALEGVGIGGGPIAGAISGLLDGFIQGIMFRFEEGLKGRQITREVQIQLGTDSGQVAAFTNTMTGYFGKIGREATLQFGTAFAGIGVVNKNVIDSTIGLAYNLNMSAGEATKILEKYMISGNTAVQAADKLQANFRKLQAAARESGLPVKTMADYILQASTNARFLNVDIGLVGNMMANLSKKTKDLSNLGVDFRQHGATIMNELASGGKSVSDAMHVFYGSKGGMEDVGVGAAWAKSMFGEKTAGSIQKTATGGFTTGGMGLGEASQGNMMMVQKLELMKQTMMDASAGASDDAEALFLQMKAAKDIFGLSDETARTLAAQGQDDVAKLADNPQVAAAMKTTDQILGEMQTVAVKSEQLQRHLVNLNMAIVKILFEIPILIIGWFDKSNLFGSGSDTLYKNSLAALSKQGGEFKQAAVGAGKVLGSMAANDMNYFGGRIDTAVRAMKGGGGGGFSEGILKEEVESETKRNFNAFYLTDKAKAKIAAGEAAKKAEGGPVSAGSLYSVGEGNKPELLMIPGNRGEVLSSDKVDKLASAGATGSGSGGGVTINLSVHGVTKDQIINQLTNEILKVLQ